ncbi:MAG: CRISPR-associated endonuclease Cas2 [Candidatus Zambryskibacteria bacterium]|nr:CRISPR-associated endonuclease Cas2 [Candidatus Zambryskibacteria bacterium]
MKNDYGERIPVGNIILSVVGIAALMSFALIMPNALQALKLFGIDKKKINRRKYYIDTAVEKLCKRDLIETVIKTNGEKYAKLTEEGRKQLFKFEFESLSKHKPKKWDKKYRIVIFDVKESLRFSRDDLRRMLINFGFVMLQNSVWVYPYPCEGAINLLKINLEMKEEVIYMTVESIENDNWLRKYFKLPKN